MVSAGFQRPTACGLESVAHPCPTLGISQAHRGKCWKLGYPGPSTGPRISGVSVLSGATLT